MFTKLFRGCTDESRQFPSSRKLKQALERLEEKEIVLQKKIAIEVDRAKEFTKTNNRQVHAVLAFIVTYARQDHQSTEFAHSDGFSVFYGLLAAMQCLKRKKFYEVEMEHLVSFQLRIHDQEQKLLHNSSVHCGKELSLTRKTTM